MAQQISKSKPLYVVTDKSSKLLSENEATYLKNYRSTFNKNANQAGKEGSNMGMGTPNLANEIYALITLPAGTNATIGVFECEETNEIYFANWNSNNFHGWYLIDGVTMLPSIIIIDPKLPFSLDPSAKIAAHRTFVRVFYQRTSTQSRTIREKQLFYTTGNDWQGCINVVAAIRTNGFDDKQYPYWKLRPPHYDRNEYLDLAVRPPMFAPIATEITPIADDIGKPNLVLDQTIQFSSKFIYTDARGTTASPYSDPVSIKDSACNTSNNGLARGYNVTLDVGSAMVEKIQLFIRFCGGDWYLYDTIERFGPMDESLDNQYWLRTNDWAPYTFDPVANTIVYPFYNDRQTGIIDQIDFDNFQSDLPLVSIGMCPAGDAILLADNLYGYNNLPTSELSKFQVGLVNQDDSGAILQSRKITLYAYLAQNGTYNQFLWTNGTDLTPRFGGISFNPGLPDTSKQLGFDAVTNDYFGLKFDDTDYGFIAYLAGTDYFAISKQYIVNHDGTMIEQGAINSLDNDQTDLVTNLFHSNGFIVQRFDFIVPPGKYIARLARHGVSSKTEFQKTSTYVMGLASWQKIFGYHGLSG